VNVTIQIIPIASLALAFIPVLVVVAILYKWSLGSHIALYASARMLIQLILIGYVLAFIFESDNAWIVITVLTVMLFASSWIALRPLKNKQQNLYWKVFVSISLGGIVILILITQIVLDLPTWYSPYMVIPLAGMIFSNSMNTVSLAAERMESEFEHGKTYDEARRIALNASMIPVINSFFAVGLVALPGMMTGQILSGISPLIAARYQIMVMCMIFGSAGISAACYLVLARTSED